MNEVELKTPAYDEEAPILPDGWEDENFLKDPSLWEDNALTDEFGAEPAEDGTNVDGELGEEDTPTTGEEDTDGPSAAPETEEPASDGAQAEVERVKRVLKLKVNHEEQEVDVNGMTDEELVAQLQKARAFDAMKDDQAKARYRQIYQDQIDAGMTASIAKLVANNEMGKEYPLEDPAEEPAAPVETPAPKVEPAAPAPRNFVQEVQQLKALYPDFKETPDEVAMAVAQGTPLLTAYVAYREKQTTKTAASLKQENEVLKHNAASAAKAPVKGVTGGGATNQKPTNPFVSGFSSDEW